jgi:hypothetical protein
VGWTCSFDVDLKRTMWNAKEMGGEKNCVRIVVLPLLNIWILLSDSYIPTCY